MTIATIADLEKLPAEQLQQVLKFAESLMRSLQETGASQSSGTWPPGVSALEAAGDIVGCATGGPPDLSSNPKYLEGFGE